LRDQLIPVISFQKNTEDFIHRGNSLVLIAHSDGERTGILIDEIIEQDEYVIKPLPLHLQGNRLVSGVIVNEKNELICVIHLPEFIESRRKFEINSNKVNKDKTNDSRKARVLVIDDSINTREIVGSIIESHGYEVSMGEDGVDGYEKAMKQDFDLIVTDIDMPRMDGFTLTEKLRSNESYINTPIIIVTSREKESDKRRGIEVGATAYIVKGGFDQMSLISAIQSLI
jgi:two-component system chemotaxis sensor kinase CheA